MSAVKAARAARAAADRRRAWYVMTSRLGREHRERGKRLDLGQERDSQRSDKGENTEA